LLEGLDLKDDTSRFQIFFKVPYPSLGDPLIKAKMQTSNEWYNWKTLNNIYQGIGRSVRSKDDWAVTYIIDGTFNNLLKHFKNDPRFQKRLKVIK
jgi:Rad3-related DNA helicase